MQNGLIRCIIIEDEELAQDVIKSHLSMFPALQLEGTYRSAAEAAKAMAISPVDVIFLDIRLPGMSGLNFLESLSAPPLVVLTTAYAEYALESYEFGVIDYLLKPISVERFSKAVRKITDKLAEERERSGSDHIFIKSNGKFCKVNFSDIQYIEGMRDYLRIHMVRQTLVTLQTMNELERSLPRGSFIRVHKSYIVAVGHISSVYGNTVEVEKETIPIGLNYRDLVMNFIGRKTR